MVFEVPVVGVVMSATRSGQDARGIGLFGQNSVLDRESGDLVDLGRGDGVGAEGLVKRIRELLGLVAEPLSSDFGCQFRVPIDIFGRVLNASDELSDRGLVPVDVVPGCDVDRAGHPFVAGHVGVANELDDAVGDRAGC